MEKSCVKPMADQAHDFLFRKIVYCEYLPGQKINEKLLLNESGFGRTPLREALLLLQKEGLVDVFPRKGMQISLITEKVVNDLYQTRKLIEPTVIQQYRSQYSKDVLLSYQQRFQKSTDSDDDLSRFHLDCEFHSYLVSVANNKLLMDMFDMLMVSQIRLGMYALIQDTSNSRENDLHQHFAIIDALLRENEQDIRDAVIFHINHSMVRSLNALRTNGVKIVE